MNSLCTITNPINPKIAKMQDHEEPVIRIMSSSQWDFLASTMVSMTFLYANPFEASEVEGEAAV